MGEGGGLEYVGEGVGVRHAQERYGDDNITMSQPLSPSTKNWVSKEYQNGVSTEYQNGVSTECQNGVSTEYRKIG